MGWVECGRRVPPRWIGAVGIAGAAPPGGGGGGAETAAADNLDTAGLGVVLDGYILDHKLAAGICIRIKLLNDRFIFGPGRGNNVEVGQHLRSVDQNVEHALPRRAPEKISEVQPHGVRSSGIETRNAVSKVAESFALVNRLGRRVADRRGVNGVCRGRGTSTIEISIGYEAARRSSPRVHGKRGPAGWCGCAALIRRRGSACQSGCFHQVVVRGRGYNRGV